MLNHEFLEDCRLLIEDCKAIAETARPKEESTTQEKRIDETEDIDIIDKESRKLINQRYEEIHRETRTKINQKYAASEKGKISLRIANLRRHIDCMNQTIENKKLKVNSMKSEVKSLELKRDSLNELC